MSPQVHSGPVLFKIFISDLDTGVECILCKFTDNSVLGGAIDCLKGQEALQKNRDILDFWAISSSLKFDKNIFSSGAVSP